MNKFLVFLGGIISACVILGSCSTGETATTAAASLLGSSSKALLFIDCRAVSENEINFEFSEPVNVKSLYFEPNLEVSSIENGSIVKVFLQEGIDPGIPITADLLAEDNNRNTVNVLVPFRSRNNNMPQLVINEVNTEYSKPKTEYIELKMLTDGNLGGMRIIINGNSNASEKTVYEFLPVNVKKGEYLTLHLRSIEESIKNEYGNSLEESVGINASPTARDFWIAGETKLIQKAASAIYVLDQDDKVLDAIMISGTPDSWWQKDYFAETADFLFRQDAWKAPDGKIARPADSVDSSKTTATRTINRDESAENSKTAASWYTSVTSGATPGKPNNPGRYQN